MHFTGNRWYYRFFIFKEPFNARYDKDVCPNNV